MLIIFNLIITATYKVTIMAATLVRDRVDSNIDAFISSIDPASMRDGKYLQAISAARKAVEVSEAELVQAIRAARRAGDSWAMIGIALRTSRQNAHRKYAHLVGEN